MLAIASQTIGVFFALPHAYPTLFADANKSPLAVFARFMYELVQLVLSTVLDKTDIERAEYLGHELLQAVPALFSDFGQKPKFHYGLAHIGTTLERHGPTPCWSGFAFESRLGDLKRACLLVANNRGVAARGADLALEMFALRTRATRLVGSISPLTDWLVSLDLNFGRRDSGHWDGVETVAEYLVGQRIPLCGTELVREAQRYEGACCAFNRESFLVLEPHAHALDSREVVYVHSMCQILGMTVSIALQYCAHNFFINIACMYYRW